MAFDTKTLYGRKRKMRGQRSNLKPFGIYSFLVKQEEDYPERYPLFIHIERPQYNIKRGIYGINLLNIERAGVRNKIIQDYIAAAEDEVKLAVLFNGTLYREAYKYYEWRNIESGLFVEISPSEAQRILRSNVFKRT